MHKEQDSCHMLRLYVIPKLLLSYPYPDLHICTLLQRVQLIPLHQLSYKIIITLINRYKNRKTINLSTLWILIKIKISISTRFRA